MKNIFDYLACHSERSECGVKNPVTMRDMMGSFGVPQDDGYSSIRLKEFNYLGAGFYFVTICTDNKKHLFGKIIDNEMHLNAAGEAALKCWLEIPEHYPNVKSDVSVVMLTISMEF